jgi:hypothetical protein
LLTYIFGEHEHDGEDEHGEEIEDDYEHKMIMDDEHVRA